MPILAVKMVYYNLLWDLGMLNVSNDKFEHGLLLLVMIGQISSNDPINFSSHALCQNSEKVLIQFGFICISQSGQKIKSWNVPQLHYFKI